MIGLRINYNYGGWVESIASNCTYHVPREAMISATGYRREICSIGSFAQSAFRLRDVMNANCVTMHVSINWRT